MQYRIWDKKEKKFLPNLVTDLGYGVIDPFGVVLLFVFKDGKPSIQIGEADRYVTTFAIEGRDMNMKQLFVGDIVKNPQGDYVTVEESYLGDMMIGGMFLRCEHVGNIFENKELIRGTNIGSIPAG